MVLWMNLMKTIQRTYCYLLKMSVIGHWEKKQSIAENLQKHFGHTSANKILKLIKLSGIVDKELVDLINEVEEKCTVFLKYKKAPLTPVVVFSLSRDFNDVISMDLKEINGF